MSVTIELPDDLAERLQAEAEKHGQALPEYVLPALEALADTQAPAEETSPAAPSAAAYLEAILEAAHALPPEVVSRFPPLGAREVDHYVYGLPVRGPETP
jgi:hypothetical protein